jgi:1-deoxy-D-xylulose-5-phosphate reductoisomerase
MVHRKRIAILGSTGSVGVSTLKVIEAMHDSFEVVLLVARSSKETLRDQCILFNPKFAALASEKDAAWLKAALPEQRTEVVSGEAGLLEAIAASEPEMTVAAIVGAAGLKPTLAAIEAGSDIALANKEAMVVAGTFVNQAAEAKGVSLLPVDSEHNALHQCLRGEEHTEVKRLILTASGGPFRDYDGDFDAITVAQALKHPTWEMGQKISIDSATMMNKGLEVIEAHFLFHFPGDQIDTIIHPQSIVHSMIETVDGSYKCQLGKTDMCEPIQYALTWPHRSPSPFETLDVTKGLSLDFIPVDHNRFPCVQLAYEALEAGGAAPSVLNAANEVSVEAFLKERIRFSDIARLNRHVLDRFGHAPAQDLDTLLAYDEEARHYAEGTIQSKQFLA